jgi:hypothetical protein
MPQVDYSKCVIYKIQHKELDELLYVGSTTHFRNRKVRHKSTCYDANGIAYNYKLYSTIRDNGGWDSFNMVIVKEFPCENKRQAEAEEDRVMREMKSSLNMKRAYLTPDEKQEKLREYSIGYSREYRNKYKEQVRTAERNYRKNNPDKIKAMSKKYYTNNQDVLKEKNKKYREENLQKTLDYGKEWREKNKEKILCECGGHFIKYNKSYHLKTKKHQAYINQQTDL